ncbi:hypothetical protein [Rathayibacter sp. AY1B8]|uniref:hypothetical protein n=1 Tax=Rathayibacter sp. AY1B8 TaxID=2080533 RepID=UPI000CE869D1|nr:hypothetical protein [Rathayibacter sp. AY1B8]PPI06342.1 hypothetical protein C5C63_10880 [Rathayibacter sp. AY1B8]
MDFTTLDLFGAPFVLEETYVYYDGPKTFALRSLVLPIVYIVNTVDEDDEEGSVLCLAVAVGEARFLAIRSGLVPFREAFDGADDGTLFLVEWGLADDNESYWSRVKAIGAETLDRSWLPAAHARLNLPTQTVEPYREDALLALSEAQNRSVIALEVESSRSNVTSLPAKNSGMLQVAFHKEFEALAREVFPGSPLVRDMFPAVLDLQAASFVVIMAVETRARLFEPVDVSAAVFDRLGQLVGAVGSGDTASFIEVMKRHTPRVRNRFREMLDALVPVDSGLALSTSVAHSRTVARSSATANQVAEALQALESEQPQIVTIPVARGVLMGLNVRLRTFEVHDQATTTRYRGRMTDDAVQEANNLTVGDEGYVSAQIRAEVPFAQDERVGAHYWLESISAYTGPAV